MVILTKKDNEQEIYKTIADDREKRTYFYGLKFENLTFAQIDHIKDILKDFEDKVDFDLISDQDIRMYRVRRRKELLQ